MSEFYFVHYLENKDVIDYICRTVKNRNHTAGSDEAWVVEHRGIMRAGVVKYSIISEITAIRLSSVSWPQRPRAQQTTVAKLIKLIL